MSTVGWIIVVIIALPAIGLLVWVWITTSVVRVPAGNIGRRRRTGRAMRPLAKERKSAVKTRSKQTPMTIVVAEA